MSKGCRDCKRCTELGIKSLAMSPFRLTASVANISTLGLLGAFRSKCPQCGHNMSEHKLKDNVK